MVKYWLIFLLILQITNPWQLNNEITSALQENLPSDLTNYLITYLEGSGKIIVFGGQSKQALSKNTSFFFNETYIFKESNNIAIKLNQSNGPSGRINSCSTKGKKDNNLYMYGGQLQNKSFSSELWQFQTITMEWKLLLNDTSYMYQHCSLYIENESLLIAGSDLNSTLSLFEFNLETNQSSRLDLIFYGYARVKVQQWDKTWVENIINIEEMNDLSFYSTQSLAAGNNNIIYNSNMILEHNMPVLQKKDTFSLDRIRFMCLVQSQNLKEFYLFLENGVYKLHRNINNSSQLEIYYVLPIYLNHEDSELECLKIQNGLILLQVNPSVLTFNMHIFPLNFQEQFLITKYTPNFYSESWIPIENSTFLTYSAYIDADDGNSINIIFHSNNKFYYLDADVRVDQMNTSQAQQIHIKNSYYGLNQCEVGWMGRTCQVQFCVNSFTLYDISGLVAISVQCSGHGNCTKDGCLCEPNWTGEDCSFYKRPNCQGQSLQNFPFYNCECNTEFEGGNDCQVTFCFNDCNSKGTCVNGTCSCYPNYYGEDCSILVMDFPVI